MKKILILGVLALCFAFAFSVSAATPTNLAAWWRFDEGSGQTAADATGVNHGQLGSTAGIDINDPNWVADQWGGYALSFDGTDDYVNAGSGGESFNFTDKFTVEAWINGEAFQSGYYDLIVFRGYSNWAFGVDRAKRLMFGEAAWNAYFSRQIYSDELSWETGKWYHIAVVYDTVRKTADFYRDGVPVGVEKQSTDKLGITSSGDVTIGYPHTVSFNGIIDEVRIWKVVIEPEDFFMDGDGDGVYGEDDKCPDATTTYDDEPTKGLGVNRHIWYGEYGNNDEYFTTLVPGTKGAKNPAQSEFSIIDTLGCNCAQILDQLTKNFGSEMQGHYKYGCSKSVLESWISDWEDGKLDGKAYIGPTFIETVNVSATSATPASSIATLEVGKDYFLNVSGTYRFANWGNYGIADAEYAYRNDSYAEPIPPDGWTLGENTYPSVFGLDVQVDDTNIYWGDYNSVHAYSYIYAGTGNPVQFHIYDSAYGDNSGFLTVDIYEDKWVDLW